MNNSLLTEVKGICAKLACGIHFFCIISVDLTVKTTVAIIMSVILKGIVWISVHLRETLLEVCLSHVQYILEFNTSYTAVGSVALCFGV